MTGSTQSTPFGSGSAFVTLIRKADGTLVDPPFPISIEGLQDVAWDDKGTLKSSHGEGAYAARLAGGKKSLTLKFTISEMNGKQMNALCYGQDIEERQLKIFKDRDGFTVPRNKTTAIKIQNSIHLNLARVDSITSVTIAGAAATLSTLDILPQDKYALTGTQLRFPLGTDRKNAVITYLSKGTTVVTTVKIPDKLTFNLSQYTGLKTLTKGTTAVLQRKVLNLAANAPEVDFYQSSNNGVIVFNSAQTGIMTMDHTTDGVPNVSSKVTALPAAAFGAHIDPPSSAVWTSTDYVLLKTDASTAMAGVVVGEELTLQATLASLASGEYMVDSKGYHLFHSADVGDVVTVGYSTDYQFVVVTPPDEGVFVRSLGVSNLGGLPLQRVTLTNPIALVKDQYTVSANGAHYFDETNGGDTLKINYLYETTGGQTFVVKNNKIGEAPTLQVDLMYELDGEMTIVSFERAKPKGTGVPTKQEDFAGMTFEMECFVNRETGIVYTLSTSV